MQDNNIENDSSEVYVYLKRPFLFNIRYNACFYCDDCMLCIYFYGI